MVKMGSKKFGRVDVSLSHPMSPQRSSGRFLHTKERRILIGKHNSISILPVCCTRTSYPFPFFWTDIKLPGLDFKMLTHFTRPAF